MLRFFYMALAAGMAGFFVLAGCSSDSGTGGDTVPATYDFERDGESTVAFVGQVTRQVLIQDLVSQMVGISDDVLGGRNLDRYDTADEVFGLLVPLFELGGAADPTRALPALLDGGDSLLQTTYADLNEAKLQDKIAGNDSVTDHRDWNGGDFVGWRTANLAVDGEGTQAVPGTPEELLRALLWTFADQASSGAVGDYPIDATTPLYLTPDGHDLTQLTEKFLLGAVNFSQAADDYLDDDVENKGLLTSNEVGEDNPYTTLEHQWDEGWGYWGAARDYDDYTDDEIAGEGGRPEYASGYFDSNADDRIDLEREYNFGASVNAAKRDRGSDAAAQTDFTAEADLAWRTGRALITDAEARGEPVDLEALRTERDIVVRVWEQAYAATAIHYVNEVLGDMELAGTEDYSFADHAKHWSELKGFALSFQFNPRSPMSTSAFSELHAAVGDAPVGASADAPTTDSAYRATLLEVRLLLGETYGFDEANIAGW